jgi:hypothetical protein
MKEAKLVIQWYHDYGEAQVFEGNDKIAQFEEMDRKTMLVLLRKLGVKTGRWKKTEWGCEATIQIKK